MKLGIILLIGTFGAAVAEPVPDGAAVFQDHCARCHGKSGRADTPGARALKVRPLAHDVKLARMVPADIARAVRANAKHQRIEAVVDLDDAQLQAVGTFVHELAKGR